MTILEKKVDALIRLCLTSDSWEREQCKRELQKILSGATTCGTVREEIAALLSELGASPNLNGYAYSLEAISIAVEDQRAARHGNIAALWEKVSAKFGAKPSNVSRCIRHVIERCFDTCDFDVIDRYFGRTISPDKGMLACGEFIAGCAEVIRERTTRK